MSLLLPSFADCRAQARETRRLSDVPASWLGGGVESHTGETVTTASALSSPAFYACNRRISQTEAMLPLVTRERDTTDRRVKRPAFDHPLYSVLHDIANPEQSAFDFRSRMTASRNVYGIAYAEIVRDRFRNVRELWQLRSDRTRVERIGGELVYFTIVNGREHALLSDQVFVLRGFSTWGVLGLNPVATLPDAIGIGLAQSEYYARFFKDNGVPPAVLESDGHFKTQEEAEKYIRDFQSLRAGLSKSHRMALLEDGLKFREIGVSPDTAQLLDGRTFQVQEICRALDCPPQLIYEMSKATFNTATMEFLSFLVLSIHPILTCWKQEITRSLISPRERSTIDAKHNPDALLQMDPKAKGEYLKSLFSIGGVTLDEIREKIDLNPYPDGSGANAFVPSNMIPVKHAEEFGEALAKNRLNAANGESERDTDSASALLASVVESYELAGRGNGNGNGEGRHAC